MIEMNVDFPGGMLVTAHLSGHDIPTDQPVQSGGQASAPTPFMLFLASLGACAGYYVLSFCKQRDLPTEGIRIVQRMENDPISHMISRVEIEIQLPAEFPAKYRSAVIRAAEQCTVKKHLESPPQLTVTTITV